MFSGEKVSATLRPGDQVPSFQSYDQEGRKVELTALLGQWVLLYFYPMDDTPGCTKQACQLRDAYSQYKKAGIVVFGVSTQGAESHKKFRKKYNLPFDLLVDEEGALGKIFNVGRMPVVGLYKRQSILIDPQGRLKAKLDNVDPTTHHEEILKLVESGPVSP